MLEPGQEISALVIDAVAKGLVKNIFTSDSLSTKLTKAQWDKGMAFQHADMFGGTEEDTTGLLYPDNAYNVLSLTWKKQFNSEGKITSEQPYALGIILGAEFQTHGFESPLGFVSFEELYNSIKAIPGNERQLSLLNALTNGEYFGYLDHTSEITLNSNSKK